MLPRRISQFFLVYFLGVMVLLGIKYTLHLSDYVIPGPGAVWQTGRTEFLRYMVDVLEQRMLHETTGFTSADILESSGNILVQKTQGGGGSPILRGFEANKILLVVDVILLVRGGGSLENLDATARASLKAIERLIAG